MMKSSETSRFTLHDPFEVDPGEVSWIWPGYIPRAEISLVTGDPGAGKTFALLSLAAAFAEGGAWPDETDVGPAGNVIYMDAENGIAAVRRRLDAQGFAGWDHLRVALADDLAKDTVVGKPQWLGTALDATLKEFAPAWVIIDPLVAFHDEEENRATSVRRLMIGLADLARRYNTAITVVQHPNKGAKGHEIQGVRGSLDFVAASRAIFLVTESSREDVSAFAVTKLNMGPVPPPQGFKLVKGRVKWVGPTELPRKGVTKEKLAIEMLEENLEDGPVPEQIILGLARLDEIGRGTLDNAARSLGVRKFKSGKGKTKLWELPG